MQMIVGQMFSYYVALELGRNIDKPRNLAKSVTVG
jgi:glucosamine--fructose-6-phosphate aminotransferase (isomerizing)